MSLNNKAQQLFSGFSKLNQAQRYQRLHDMGALTEADIDFLKQGGIKDNSLAENFIENVLGYFQLPLGVASYFCIDGKDYAIPMAVEETSIIAALSKTAKWIKEHGSITTEIHGNTLIGQLQIAKVGDIEHLQTIIENNAPFLIEQANEEVAHGLVRRGGGVRDITLRQISRPDEASMAVIHVAIDCCDAMGANIINQTLEFLKPLIENLSGEKVTMCILSNLNDSKLTVAKVELNNIDPGLGTAIQEASLFAENDPYRAATHNKGVLNGIDPIVIATGNDWRAVEAGIHAHACRDGQYRAITRWRYHEKTGQLHGEFEAPLIVGIVGGVTQLHPTAKLSLSMLDVRSANELSAVMAAVGLVQNLGALKALCTDGIIKGHMKLHIDNLSLSAGAKLSEMPELKQRLQHWLSKHRRVSLSNAVDLLSEMRQEQLSEVSASHG